MVGTQSACTISPPSASDNYGGPPSFNAYLDNLYQTFMFFSPNRSQVTNLSIVPSSTSLTFGTVSLGQTSSGQVVTITNGSSSDSLSFDPAKLGAGISISNASYALQNNSCTSVLAPNASCSVTVVFTPNSNDAPAPGANPDPATMIVGGVQLGAGSTNVLRTVSVALNGTALR